MSKKVDAAAWRDDAETKDEIVGVLTAISVVSKRLARRLALLEKPPNDEGSDTDEERRSTVPTDAD